MGYELCVLRKDEFEKFINKLDGYSQARLIRDITFLKENGSRLGMPYAKKVHKGLWELRTSGKQKVRVIYSIKGMQIYVVHWLVKKTMKIPARDLNTAIKRLTEI